MSLDLTLCVKVHNMNLTHNLTSMASHVEVGKDDLTLYDVLWRPDEHYMYHADDILPYVRTGLKELLHNPSKYEMYNPTNGWGSYDTLVKQVTELLFQLELHPQAYLQPDR